MIYRQSLKSPEIELPPWSIDNSVTGVSESSQQSSNLKDAGYK
ncbi:MULTISPECIES: hypothetical protein [Photorhabdus]|nr:hypothetical protein [Photorhabdus asymbiotica]